MKKYLIYIQIYNIIARDYITRVYECETPDIFHTMGEIPYRTLEHIKRINFTEYTEDKRKFWEDEGFTIYPWKDKYPYAKN